MRCLYASLLLFFATSIARAQDVIHFTNGTEQQVIVKKIATQTITYKKYDNADGPDYTENVNTIDHISFANGTEAGFAALHPHGNSSSYDKQYYRRLKHLPVTESFQLIATPSSLLDPWGVMLPISLQYNFGKYFGVEAMAAIPLFFNTIGGKYYGIRVTKIKQDEKFSLSLIAYPYSKPGTRIFVGVEGFYRHQLLSLGSGKIREGNSYDYLLFTSSDLLKDYYGGGIRFGVEKKITGHLWADAYAGLGLMGGTSWHKDLQGTSNVSGPRKLILDVDIPNTSEGKVRGIYIPCAVRFSYHFDHAKK